MTKDSSLADIFQKELLDVQRIPIIGFFKAKLMCCYDKRMRKYNRNIRKSTERIRKEMDLQKFLHR